MTRHHLRDGERGAAAILFVSLVVAAAIVAAATMMIGRPQFAVQQATGTGFDMTALRKAVEAHAWTRTDATPPEIVGCPSDDTCDLPWTQIGVTARQATDSWGQPVRLVRGTSGDEPPTVNLTSSVLGLDEEPCNFVLISRGANGQFDYEEKDEGSPSAVTLKEPDELDSPEDADIAVCGILGSGDDYTPPTLLNGSFTKTGDTANNIAPRMKTPPREDWAESDEVMYFGGSSDDPDTYDLTAGNVNKTACAWHDQPFDFTTQVLRGYLRFQFLPGELLSGTVTGTGQGFALMVIPGDRTVTSTTCGTAGSDNAYGFKGVARPKFALEFDTFRDNYEGEDDHSGGRDNPKPEGNHVALLNPITNDYISHGGYGNPPCYNRDDGGTGPAMNGGPGACTYPPADEAERPARHAVRPANWLEDKQYDDAALGRLAAQPYQVRFEIKRRCNSGCSTCGVAVPEGVDEDTLGDGNTYIQFKAWVACDEVLEGNPNACPDFPDTFQRLNALYGGTTEYMVNYCMPDRSFSYAEDFTTVKLGVGFSTRSSAVALMLHRFEALSEDAP